MPSFGRTIGAIFKVARCVSQREKEKVTTYCLFNDCLHKIKFSKVNSLDFALNTICFTFSCS